MNKKSTKPISQSNKRRIRYQELKKKKKDLGWCDDCSNDNHVDCARWKPNSKQPPCKCPKCKGGKYVRVHGPVPEKEKQK